MLFNDKFLVYVRFLEGLSNDKMEIRRGCVVWYGKVLKDIVLDVCWLLFFFFERECVFGSERGWFGELWFVVVIFF